LKAILTVGLGFGDEGKGATVDHLTRELGARVVVRYCGGAQAGHNVATTQGKRHTFSQFGAGTLAGASTYLGPRVIINPGTMVPEAEHLEALGIVNPWNLLVVHPECLVATTYHMVMNRLRELSRGSSRHGSCGLGIGETRHFAILHQHHAIQARDLQAPSLLRDKLYFLRERFLRELATFKHLDSQLLNEMTDWTPDDEVASLCEVGERLQMDRSPPASEVMIFEGAQGTLLDESFGFHPYTTWSTVTTQHAWEILRDMFPQSRPPASTDNLLSHSEDLPYDVHVLGLTRSYTTRHGVGPFPSYCPKLSQRLYDVGNPENPWQGALRFGSLDFVLLEYATRVCPIDALIVNHLDEFHHSQQIVTDYSTERTFGIPTSREEQESLTRLLEHAHPIAHRCNEAELLERLETIAPVVGTSYGPTSADRQFRNVF
jgi:adenylosuccinate synthase